MRSSRGRSTASDFSRRGHTTDGALTRRRKGKSDDRNEGNPRGRFSDPARRVRKLSPLYREAGGPGGAVPGTGSRASAAARRSALGGRKPLGPLRSVGTGGTGRGAHG